MRRAYGGGRGSALARGVTAFIALFPMITVYRMLLFLAVFYSLEE